MDIVSKYYVLHTIKECKDLFIAMINKARCEFQNAPIDKAGCLFLKKTDFSIYFPCKEDFENENYIIHTGKAYGSFPKVKDIA